MKDIFLKGGTGVTWADTSMVNYVASYLPPPTSAPFQLCLRSLKSEVSWPEDVCLERKHSKPVTSLILYFGIPFLGN